MPMPLVVRSVQSSLTILIVAALFVSAVKAGELVYEYRTDSILKCNSKRKQHEYRHSRTDNSLCGIQSVTQSISLALHPNTFNPEYNPSKVAAGVAGGLYFIASLSLFTRLFMNRAWWGLCLPIASTCKSPK
jgi:hypothetical protein